MSDDTTDRNASQVDSDTRYDMAAAFLQRLTGNSGAPVTFQTFGDSPSKNAGLAHILHGTLGDHFDSLMDLNDNGAGVFVTINETDLAGRRAENIKRIRAVHIDDDDGQSTPESLPLPPQMIVETSPNKQQVYILTDTENFEQYDGVIERMVKDHGCDPGAKGRNRVFRLPGFYHKKNPAAPHLVSITRMTDDPPYAWAEILKAFPPCSNGNKEKKSAFDDPVYQHLQSNGWVLDTKPDGRVHIRCPFKDSHTTGDAVSSTTYFIAHTNGFKHGHFKCQHGHCAERSDAAFLFAVGYTGAETGTAEPKPKRVPTRAELVITADEWVRSSLSPKCIVKDYLYADISVMTAPGGTGKTTQIGYEAIHIALARELYGKEIVTPGWTLFITAEDAREILIARLRQVAQGMGLTNEEMAVVRRRIIIWDVSGDMMKLIRSHNGTVNIDPIVEEIIATHEDDPPVKVVIDPSVSFGIGEDKINVNEQGLIQAGRVLRNGLNCCVRFIHHTGKIPAREKLSDQYAGRGGSAFADGARMVTVMYNWSPSDTTRPPEGCIPGPGVSISTLHQPKLSYAAPGQPAIWIRRVGWAFECFVELPVSEEEADQAIKDQVMRFVASELGRNVHYTKTNLRDQHKKLNLKQRDVSQAITQLIAEGRLQSFKMPTEKSHTSNTHYLGPARTTLNDFEEPQPHETKMTDFEEEVHLKEGKVNYFVHLPSPVPLKSFKNARTTLNDLNDFDKKDDADDEEITWDTVL